MKTIKSILLTVSLGLCLAVSARENLDGTVNRLNNPDVIQTGCTAGKTQTELKLNAVRTRILTDGDMWWDLANGKYEVPQGSNSMAQFAGSLWFGGYYNGALRISAMTYRQTGIDFWPGPLDPSTVDVDASTCAKYDKHWVFKRADVDNFYAYWAQSGAADPATPSWIKDYPGSYEYSGIYTVFAAGQPVSMNYLAPYYDNNGDGFYNYADGDYPNYNVSGASVPRGQCVRRLFGDETIFWVFNDKGNRHGESGSTSSIGVEIRAQAFEFATGDELNQMSFYNYEVINWSTDKLDSTYFTVWDDCDLGNYQDDYIGCDVTRGLGYEYNGDNYDEDGGGITGYHDKLPAIGVDFFQGPYADEDDGIDNDRDGCLDCSFPVVNGVIDTMSASTDDGILPEQIVMSRFTYYTNTGNVQNGNVSSTGAGIQFYNYMSGKWRDGSPMTYGAAGLLATNQPCSFLFPGNSDPRGWGLGHVPGGPSIAPVGSFGSTGWTQQQAGVVKADMRFLQSCGKFTLKPGAVNYVTYGLPFARSNAADNFAPVALLQTADDKAQALFDNCFKVLDGPDSPDLTLQEISNQLLFTISNNPYTNNNYEAKRYAEADASIQAVGSITNPDKLYRFEGYMVFQLKDETVTPQDLYNTDKARIVFQCDVKNGVSQLINYVTDPALGLIPQAMVIGGGENKGIKNSFAIAADKFAASDPRMVNFQNYYYMAISYAYNNFLTYVPNAAPTAAIDTNPPYSSSNPGISFSDGAGSYNGQKKPFLLGRRNIKVYTGIPHDPSPEANGTVMNSSYGIGPQITRVEGQGNGGLPLDLTDQSISDILNSPISRAQKITYVGNRGPIGVKVTDPLRIVKGDFTVKFIASTKVKIGTDSLWQYLGNPPTAGSTTLDTGKIQNSSKMRWYMTGTYTDASGNSISKTWLSDEGINLGQEKIVTGASNEPLGFSVTVRQVTDPGLTAKAFTVVGIPTLNYGLTQTGDLLESSITFANTATPWLGAVKDQDGDDVSDWILSGGNTGDVFGKYAGGSKSFFADVSEVWENVVKGTWAPFRFVKGSGTSTPPEFGPSYNTLKGTQSQLNPRSYGDTRLLSSVDIVFTADKSRWSRCPVVDMNPANDKNTNGGGANILPYKWQLRREKSVDKDGNKNFPSTDNSDVDSSMSWFPGYAINVETGERLNIIFSENSADTVNRGTDMMWNPTKNISDSKGLPIHGGMHYIYVCGHNADGNDTIAGEITPADIRRYDMGVSAYRMIRGLPSWPRPYSVITGRSKWSLLAEVFKDIMWTNIPLSANGYDIATPSSIPCDVKVRIRVQKPYRYGLSTVTSPANTSTTTATNIIGISINTPLNSNAVVDIPADVVSNPQNGNFPMYTFNTNDLAAKNYDESTAHNAMAKINIVPNPYYGHSAYEKTRLDNVVKIINLPVKCKLRFYTLAGTLIRTIEKDNDQTYTVWDLKNDKSIQVASGLYIIHIDAPGIGERIIKWFGVMRPYDLQSY